MPPQNEAHGGGHQNNHRVEPNGDRPSRQQDQHVFNESDRDKGPIHLPGDFDGEESTSFPGQQIAPPSREPSGDEQERNTALTTPRQDNDVDQFVQGNGGSNGLFEPTSVSSPVGSVSDPQRVAGECPGRMPMGRPIPGRMPLDRPVRMAEPRLIGLVAGLNMRDGNLGDPRTSLIGPEWPRPYGFQFEPEATYYNIFDKTPR